MTEHTARTEAKIRELAKILELGELSIQVEDQRPAIRPLLSNGVKLSEPIKLTVTPIWKVDNRECKSGFLSGVIFANAAKARWDEFHATLSFDTLADLDRAVDKAMRASVKKQH